MLWSFDLQFVWGGNVVFWCLICVGGALCLL